MNNDNNKFITVYEYARKYLNEIAPPGVSLEKYYRGDQKEFKTLSDVFVQFIFSAQNYQRMPNVIAFKDRKDAVGEILKGFDIDAVSAMNFEDLYKEFRKKFKITSADSNHNSWKKWSHSIVDSAIFLKEFENVADFKEFVNLFDYNVHTSMALPLLISTKISGIGFALACDLLKEMGFTRYPKPDVHLINVFTGLGLSKNDPVSVFEDIVRMSNICKEVDENVTPYKIDKMIWLICSGNFHLETPEIKIGSRKKEFINLVRQRL